MDQNSNLHPSTSQSYDPVLLTEELAQFDQAGNSATRKLNQVTQNTNQRFILRQADPIRVSWDLFVMALATWNVFSIPFTVAFDPAESVAMDVANSFTDVMFLVDIILNFRTTFINLKTGDEIFDPKMIRKNYFKGGKFAIDLLATIPLDTIAELAGSKNKSLQLFGLLKLIRILRLSKIIAHMRVKKEVKLTLKFLQLILFIIMYLHLIGCVWFLIVNSDKKWLINTDSILEESDFYEADIWKRYSYSFYTAVFMLIGAEMLPVGSLQFFYCGIMVLISAMVTAVMFGEVAVVMSSLRSNTTRFNQMMDTVNTAMKNMKLPEPLQLKISDYLIATQSKLYQQEEYEEFFKSIPLSFQTMVNSQIYKRTLMQNVILKRSSALTDQIIKRLKTLLTQPEQPLCQYGEEADRMFFVMTGRCVVMIPDENDQMCQIRYVHPSQYFGEIAILYETKRTATVTTIEYCNIACLMKLDVVLLLNKHRQIKNRFY